MIFLVCCIGLASSCSKLLVADGYATLSILRREATCELPGALGCLPTWGSWLLRLLSTLISLVVVNYINLGVDQVLVLPALLLQHGVLGWCPLVDSELGCGSGRFLPRHPGRRMPILRIALHPALLGLLSSHFAGWAAHLRN